MATFASDQPHPVDSGDRFFLYSSFAMAFVIAAGFSLQLAAGRSSFSAPPLVHAHAVVFMGWVGIYLLQNVYAATGRLDLHRRLGWISALWVPAMLVLGCLVTVVMVRDGRVPFFFVPLQFLVFDPMTLFTFAGLTVAAIVMRRRTDWHRRLHFCAMTILLGPGFGRLLPMPLLPPFAFEVTFAATMLFPLAGVIADLKRTGRVHPAWGWGIATLLASLVMIEVINYSPLGSAIYDAVTTGSPGAGIAPLEFGKPPG